MKKLNYLIAMAFAAFTLTSCEDVPAPYGQPTDPNTNVNVDPAGSGTESDPFNVAAAIAKCKEIGSTESTEKYYVKGYAATVGTADGQYGNASFDMTDSKDGKGKRFKAYQVLGSDGQKMVKDYTINAGDEVIIYGPIYNYNGTTPETASKGAAYIVTVNGQKTTNVGGGGEDTSSGEGDGTEAKPYNVAAAIAAGSGSNVFIKAYIVGWIDGQVLSTGAKFDGAATAVSNILIANTADETDVTKCMPVQLPNGAVRDAVNLQNNSGNYKKEIILVGNIEKYFGTTGVKGTSYAKIGETEAGTKPGSETPAPSGEAKGSGTQADPFNIVAINQEAAKLEQGKTSEQDYYFKGKISTIKYAYDAEHGTGTFFVSDDGSTTGEFQVYSALFLENKNWASGNTQIKVGDEVMVCGKITNYNGTLETASKKAYIYSLNGKTTDEGAGGGDTPATNSTYLDEPFETSQGKFTIDNKTLGEGLTAVWKHDSSNKYMKASGYNSGNKESESWLISPEIDLSKATKPTLTFSQVINKYFGTVADEALVYVKKDGGEWTKVTITFPTIETGNWSKFADDGANQSIDLSGYKSSKTQFAFVYKSSTTAAGTWEIKAIKVAEPTE